MERFSAIRKCTGGVAVDLGHFVVVLEAHSPSLGYSEAQLVNQPRASRMAKEAADGLISMTQVRRRQFVLHCGRGGAGLGAWSNFSQQVVLSRPSYIFCITMKNKEDKNIWLSPEPLLVLPVLCYKN